MIPVSWILCLFPSHSREEWMTANCPPAIYPNFLIDLIAVSFPQWQYDLQSRCLGVKPLS